MKKVERSTAMQVMKKMADFKITGLTIAEIERLAVKFKIDEHELLRIYIDAKNNAYIDRYAATPYSDRIMLLPQCLRTRECPAKLGVHGYECTKCGKCGLSDLILRAESLGYAVFILPGGSVVEKILKEYKPKACLAVACLKELMLGSFVCEKFGVITQCIALLRDGCVKTDVNWGIVKDFLLLSRVQ
ncbi:MAG TPA: DUF116 domain-containing protein [archaeon]|jgi:hypothetical protein|nr:DUF116 domain-containing protein [archaeon]